MAKINENKLAKEVSEDEGGVENLSVAQIKEVIRLTLENLANNYAPSEVLALVEKHTL